MNYSDKPTTAWQRVLDANNGYAPLDRVDQLDAHSAATLYGTVPLPIVHQVRDLVHLALPRDLSTMRTHPDVIKMLKPYMMES